MATGAEEGDVVAGEVVGGGDGAFIGGGEDGAYATEGLRGGRVLEEWEEVQGEAEAGVIVH